MSLNISRFLLSVHAVENGDSKFFIYEKKRLISNYKIYHWSKLFLLYIAYNSCCMKFSSAKKKQNKTKRSRQFSHEGIETKRDNIFRLSFKLIDLTEFRSHWIWNQTSYQTIFLFMEQRVRTPGWTRKPNCSMYGKVS